MALDVAAKVPRDRNNVMVKHIVLRNSISNKIKFIFHVTAIYRKG